MTLLILPIQHFQKTFQKEITAIHKTLNQKPYNFIVSQGIGIVSGYLVVYKNDLIKVSINIKNKPSQQGIAGDDARIRLKIRIKF